MSKKSSSDSTAASLKAKGKSSDELLLNASNELFRALNALRTVCQNTSGLKSLIHVRMKREQLVFQLMSIKEAERALRANELARLGAPFVEQWDAIHDCDSASHPVKESFQDSKLIDQIRTNLIEPGLAECDLALRAMRAGGARILESTAKGKRAAPQRSIEIHIDLQDARDLFIKLSLGVSIAVVQLQGDVRALAKLCRRLDRACKEIRASLETSSGVSRIEKSRMSRGPKTTRGLMKYAKITSLDIQIVQSVREGRSYREVAKEFGVSKSSVARVCQAHDLTGHRPDTVPLGGTLDENLRIRGKSRKPAGK